MKIKQIVPYMAVMVAICATLAKPAEDLQAELVLDAKAMLGEGSIWVPSEQKLYWIDIEGKFLHIYDPETKQDRQLPVDSRVGTVVPVKGGGVLVALQTGIK